MKVILLLVLSVICNCAISQTDSFVKGEMYSSDRNYLFSNLDTINCKSNNLSSIEVLKNKFYIIGDTNCKTDSPKWFILVHDNKRYFAEKFFFSKRVNLDNSLKLLKQQIPDINERHRVAAVQTVKAEQEEEKQLAEQEAKAAAEARELEVREKRQLDSINREYDKSLTKLRAKDVVLYEWNWDYDNSYAPDISITVINPYKKKIKYLWFTFRAYNAVDDLINDGVKTVKGIGPIEYGDKGSYNFENVIYSSVIDKIKFNQIKIQFFDGSFKVISKPISIKNE